MIETSDTNAAAYFVLLVAPPIDNNIFSNVFQSIRDTAHVKITSILPDVLISFRLNVLSLTWFTYIN